MNRFMTGKFPLILNRGHRRNAYRTNRIMGSIGVMPMQETWFR